MADTLSSSSSSRKSSPTTGGLPAPDVIYEADCPTRNLLELIADKWALLVLHALHDGPARNGALLRRLHGISQKMLTQTLRDLERNGLVRRVDYREVPPRVEYHATPLGDSLGCKIAGLAQWVNENLASVEAARTAYDSQAGGV